MSAYLLGDWEIEHFSCRWFGALASSYRAFCCWGVFRSKNMVVASAMRWSFHSKGWVIEHSINIYMGLSIIRNIDVLRYRFHLRLHCSKESILVGWGWDMSASCKSSPCSMFVPPWLENILWMKKSVSMILKIEERMPTLALGTDSVCHAVNNGTPWWWTLLLLVNIYETEIMD